MKLLEIESIPEFFDTSCYEQIDYSTINSQMADTERRFISGLIRLFKPNQILEIGVSRGGGTVNILNAIKDEPGVILTSIDRASEGLDIKGKSYKIGCEAIKLFPESIGKKWNLIVGKDPSEVIDGFTDTFDFVIIDTAHAHPVECLNFLTVLPYLRNDAIVVLHDISNYLIHDKLLAFSPRLLWSSIVADKLTPTKEYDFIDGRGQKMINVGAFQVCDDTRMYIRNIFDVLMLPWQTYPADDIDSIRNVLI